MIRTALLSAVLLAAAGTAAGDGGPGLPGGRWSRWQTGALRADRLQHASLAFSSGLGLGVLSREPGVALGGALALGLAKELLDARREGFDLGDLAADGVGAACAAWAVAALTR